MRAFLRVTCALLVAGSLWAQLQPPNVQAGDQVDVLPIVVTRFGPYPASVTRSQGAFVLAVVNRSGILEDTYSLVLAPAAGAAAGSAQTPPASLLGLHSTSSKQRDHQLINPKPGDYQLLFLSHPDWVVTIAISAN